MPLACYFLLWCLVKNDYDDDENKAIWKHAIYSASHKSCHFNKRTLRSASFANLSKTAVGSISSSWLSSLSIASMHRSFNLPSVMVDLRYVLTRFIVEKLRSALALAIGIVNTILVNNKRSGNAVAILTSYTNTSCALETLLAQLALPVVVRNIFHATLACARNLCASRPRYANISAIGSMRLKFKNDTEEGSTVQQAASKDSFTENLLSNSQNLEVGRHGPVSWQKTEEEDSWKKAGLQSPNLGGLARVFFKSGWA